MQNQSWRFDVARVLQRRAVPIQIHLLKNVAAEIGRVSVRAIAGTVIRNEVRETAQCDRRFEAICMTDDPVSHEAAIAATRHAHPILIDPWIFSERGIESVHDVLIIFAAPFTDDAALKLLTITGRAARVCEQHRVPVGRINLKLVIPIDAILPRRTAVNAENQRILFARLPINRLDEETIDVPIVRINLKLVIPIDAILPRRTAVNAENQRILFARLPINRLDEETID